MVLSVGRCVHFSGRIIDNLPGANAGPRPARRAEEVSARGSTSCSTRISAAASASRRTSRSCQSRSRPGIMRAREAVERDVLLDARPGRARNRGASLQRVAILDAFDGSVLQGAQSYARQPEAMIDVGNDREFGFLHQMPTETHRTHVFAALLTRRRICRPPAGHEGDCPSRASSSSPADTPGPSIDGSQVAKVVGDGGNRTEKAASRIRPGIGWTCPASKPSVGRSIPLLYRAGAGRPFVRELPRHAFHPADRGGRSEARLHR